MKVGLQTSAMCKAVAPCLLPVGDGKKEKNCLFVDVHELMCRVNLYAHLEWWFLFFFNKKPSSMYISVPMDA